MPVDPHTGTGVGVNAGVDAGVDDDAGVLAGVEALDGDVVDACVGARVLDDVADVEDDVVIALVTEDVDVAAAV